MLRVSATNLRFLSSAIAAATSALKTPAAAVTTLHQTATTATSSGAPPLLLSPFQPQLCTARRFNTSNSSEEVILPSHLPDTRLDYFRIATLADAVPPPKATEWRTTRGSGPGGQGVNSSSNKAELRVDLDLWRQLDPQTLCDETFDTLLKKQASLITKNNVLIVSSHEHRSLDKNRDECMAKVMEVVRDASFVPAPPPPPPEPDLNRREQLKEKRKIKTNKNRLRRSVRKGGKISGSSW